MFWARRAPATTGYDSADSRDRISVSRTTTGTSREGTNRGAVEFFLFSKHTLLGNNSSNTLHYTNIVVAAATAATAAAGAMPWQCVPSTHTAVGRVPR